MIFFLLLINMAHCFQTAFIYALLKSLVNVTIIVWECNYTVSFSALSIKTLKSSQLMDKQCLVILLDIFWLLGRLSIDPYAPLPVEFPFRWMVFHVVYAFPYWDFNVLLIY